MKLKTKQDVILNFISQFNKFGTQVEDCFTCGMCYHFAEILNLRFIDENTKLLYDQVMGHFAVEINGRIYDITGDITDKSYHCWTDWRWIRDNDPLLAKRIRKHCNWKVPDGVVLCEFCEHSFYDDWGTMICDRDNHPVTGNDSCEKGVSA